MLQPEKPDQILQVVVMRGAGKAPFPIQPPSPLSSLSLQPIRIAWSMVGVTDPLISAILITGEGVKSYIVDSWEEIGDLLSTVGLTDVSDKLWDLLRDN